MKQCLKKSSVQKTSNYSLRFIIVNLAQRMPLTQAAFKQFLSWVRKMMLTEEWKVLMVPTIQQVCMSNIRGCRRKGLQGFSCREKNIKEWENNLKENQRITSQYIPSKNCNTTWTPCPSTATFTLAQLRFARKVWFSLLHQSNNYQSKNQITKDSCLIALISFSRSLKIHLCTMHLQKRRSKYRQWLAMQKVL